MNNHNKALASQDAKINSANKKLKATKASVDRTEARFIEAHKRTDTNPDSEKLRNDLERVRKSRDNAGSAYTKAIAASIDTIGTGSGRVMVLLPSHVAKDNQRK